jgi:hypothetical protein
MEAYLHSAWPFLRTLLPLAAAAALAVAGYYLLAPVVEIFSRRGAASRLDSFATLRSEKRAAEKVAFGGEAHRLRVAFARYRIDITGKEQFALWAARIAAGASLFVVLKIIGLPFMTALVGFPAGYILLNGLVQQAWNKVRSEVESEIPTLLNSLSSTFQTSPNVIAAVESVAETLRQDGPMRLWLASLLETMHAEGIGGLEAVSREAADYSPSLSIVVELIQRMWQTGGSGYAQAFIAAAENLEVVLDARVDARAVGDASRGVINILMGATVAMMAIFTRNEGLSEMVSNPLVQIAYTVILLAVVYGQTQINKIIDEAV